MVRLYRKKALVNAKYLRKNPTDVERILWEHLRNRRLMNIKFLKQVPIDKYIADFVCNEKKLIVEVDGSQHIDNVEYDSKRTKRLNDLGYKVIRVYNNDIFNNINGVLDYIYDEFKSL